MDGSELDKHAEEGRESAQQQSGLPTLVTNSGEGQIVTKRQFAPRVQGDKV